jgi:hypothetical protein
METSINIQETIEKIWKKLTDEPNLSPALKATCSSTSACSLPKMTAQKLIKQQHPAAGRPEPGKNIQCPRKKKARRTDRASGNNPEACGYA